MSKAFTKEKENENDDDLEGSAEDETLKKIKKNYMTPQCFERLKAEVHQLLVHDRPEVVRTVAWAASNGDRSENGDYIYGKRRLREIDRRIRFLTKRLDASEVIDPALQKADRVLFGATVKVQDEDGDEKRYSIVGIDESDPKKGRISWISPLAKALLNAKVGDAVTLHTPKGEQELEILEIKYQSLE